MSSTGKSHQNDDYGRSKSDRRSSPNPYYRSRSRDRDQSADSHYYRRWSPSRREKEGSRWDSDRNYKITSDKYHQRYRPTSASTYVPYSNPYKLDRRNAPGREQNYAKDDNYENSESFTLFGKSKRLKNASPEDHRNGQPREQSAENSANATSGKHRSMERRMPGGSEMHKKAITEHLKNTFLRNNSPLTQVPPMFSHNQLLIDKLIAEEAIKMLSSGKASNEETSFNDANDAAEVSPSPAPTATAAETAKPSTPIGIKLPVRTISKATVAADSALLQKSAEQVTRKLINQLTTMNKYNLKQMIDNPAGKYETALNRHAQSKVRAEMRKQLKSFHPVEAIKEKDSQHDSYVLAPDEVIDLERLPDALLDQLQNALDLDMFSVPCPESAEVPSQDVSISDDESAQLDKENESSTVKRGQTANGPIEPDPEKANERASISASVAVANGEPSVPTEERATRDTSSLIINIKKRWSNSRAQTSAPSSVVVNMKTIAKKRFVKSPQMKASTPIEKQQRPVVVRTYGRRILPKATPHVSSNDESLVGAPEPSVKLDEKNKAIEYENIANVAAAPNPEQPTAGCSVNVSQPTPVSQVLSVVESIPQATKDQNPAVKTSSFLRVSTVDELNKRIDTNAEEVTAFNSTIPPPTFATGGLKIQQTCPLLNEPSSVNQKSENERFTAPDVKTPIPSVVPQVEPMLDRSNPPVLSATKQSLTAQKTTPTKATRSTTPNSKSKQFTKGNNKTAKQKLFKKQASPARGNEQTKAKAPERTKGIIWLVPVTDEEPPLPSEQVATLGKSALPNNKEKEKTNNNKAQAVCSSSLPSVPSNEQQVNNKTASTSDNAKSTTTPIAKKRRIESLQMDVSTSNEGASSPEHNVTPPIEAPQHPPFMRIADIRSLTEPSHRVSSDGMPLDGATTEPSIENRIPSPVALTSLNADPVTADADNNLREKQLEQTPVMILPDRIPSSHEACAVILNRMHAIDSQTFELFKRKMEIDAIIMRLNIERIEIDQEIVKLQNKRDEQMDSLRSTLFIPRVHQLQPENFSSGTMNGDAMQTNDPSYGQDERQADLLSEEQDEKNSSSLSADTWLNTESSSEPAPNTQPSQTSSSQERTIRRITMISGNSDLMRIFQRKRVMSERSSDDNATPEDSIMLGDVPTATT